MSVTAYTVTRQDMKRKISLSGQTVPVAQVDISTKYAGKIADVAVNLGDVVAPGQVLLIQDTVDTNLTLNQDKAALEQAVADSRLQNRNSAQTCKKQKSNTTRPR